MLYKKLLITGTLSTLLLATTLFAQTNCVGGVCFIDLKNLKPTTKGFKHEKAPLVVLEKPRYLESNSESNTHIDSLAIDDVREIDKSITIVVDGDEVTVFPSYVMTEEEKVAYYAEQEAIALNKKSNKEANRDLLMVSQPVKRIEDKILEKTELPVSEYYCEKDTHPVYDKVLDSFQCV